MGRLLTVMVAVAASLLLAGCGGGDDAVGTGPGADGGPAGVPTTFESTQFEPPVTFQLPGGWRAEDQPEMIQAFSGDNEAYAVTFEATPEGGDVTARVEQMRGTAQLDAQEPQEVTVAGHEALLFEATPQVPVQIEGSEYFALRGSALRVWVVDVEGTLVTIFAEAGELRTERRRDEEATAAFFNQVQTIIESLEFGGSAPGGTGTDGGTDGDTGTETG